MWESEREWERKQDISEKKRCVCVCDWMSEWEWESQHACVCNWERERERKKLSQMDSVENHHKPKPAGKEQNQIWQKVEIVKLQILSDFKKM